MSEKKNENLKDEVGFLRFYFLESKGKRDEFGRRVDSLTEDQGSWVSEQTEPTRVIFVNNEMDVRAAYRFDEKGHPVSFTNAAGEVTRAVYNDEGRMVEVHFPNGNVSRYEYDEAGQRVYFEEPGQSGVYARTFDMLGNLRTESTSRYGTIETKYNDNGKLLEITNALGGSSRFTYDFDSRLLTTTTPTGATEVLTRDEKGQVTGKKDFSGALTQATFTPDGKPLTHTFANGDVQAWNYDESGHNRLTTINGAPVYQFDYKQYPDGTYSSHTTEYLTPVQPTWRETFRVNSAGHNVDRITNGVTHRWDRDQLGRATAYYGPDGMVLKRRFSAKGDLMGMTDSSGYTVDYQRDELGNVVGYESPNIIRKVTWDNGFVSMIEEIRSDVYGKILSQTSFMRDEQGKISDIMRDGSITSFMFDAARQLTGVHHTDANGETTKATWSYDEAGRMTESVTPDGVRKTYTYSPDCRLLEVRGEDGSAVHNFYDERGRRVRTEYSGGALDGEFVEFGWDSRGYLWQLSQGGANKETRYHHFWFNMRGELCWADGVTIAWDISPGQEVSVVAIDNRTLTVQDYENITCSRANSPFGVWSGPAYAHPQLPAGMQIGLDWKFRLANWDLRMDSVIDLEQLQRLDPRNDMEPIGYATDFNPYAYLNNNPLYEFAPWNI